MKRDRTLLRPSPWALVYAGSSPWGLFAVICLVLIAGCATPPHRAPNAPEAASAPGSGLFIDAAGKRQWLLPGELNHSGQGSYQWPDGRSYKGEWVAGIPQGKGQGQLASGAHYEGDWVQGLPHGLGRLSKPDGEAYRGEFDTGVRSGTGENRSAAGIYTGQWENDAPHGEGRFRGIDGSEYLGQYRQGARHGSGRFVSATGSVYEGDWLADEPSGFGTLLTPDGARHEGQWLDGQTAGYGEYVHPAGLRYQGAWEAGKRSGFGEEQRPDGSRYEGDWRDNLMHGKGVLQLADGTRYEGSWQQGRMHGKGRQSQPAGYTFSGDWQDAKLVEGQLQLLGPPSSQYEGPLFEADGQTMTKDLLAWLQPKATAGNAAAAYLLGTQLMPDKSAELWLEQAASANIAHAQYQLGYLLLSTDLRGALAWLNKAANGKPRSSAQAQHLLGTLYHFGELLPQDEDQAEALYERAAANGHLPARRNLALMLATTSIDYLHDTERALALIEPLANLHGSAQNLNTLATVYSAHGERDAAARAQRAAIAALSAEPATADQAAALAEMHLRLETFESNPGAQQGGKHDND